MTETIIDTWGVPDYTSMLDLTGRSFIVAGAGRGMGRQSAHAIAANGGRVLCVDIDETRAKSVAAEVGGIPYVADIRSAEAVDSLLETADREFDAVDGLVDIVGLARYAAIIDMPEDDWDWVQNTVIRHAFLLLRAVGRRMAAQRHGSMVFIASMNGIASAPYHAAYGAAKAGLIHLMKTAAWELRLSQVRVNAVAPGSIATPRVVHTRHADAEAVADGNLESMGRPSNIAAAVLFFLSDLSSYVTGQTLAVDGGILAKNPFDMDGPPLPPGHTMGDVV